MKRVALALVITVYAVAAPISAARLPGVSAQDENYLQTSAAGDSFEIKGGQLALQKSQNPKVRELATTLIRDHTKSLHDAKSLARTLRVPKVENKPTPSQSWELRQLQAMTGGDFDKQYADLEVSDHHQDIQETKFEVKKGFSPAVRAAAKDELPTLAKHLKLSGEALAASGG